MSNNYELKTIGKVKADEKGFYIELDKAYVNATKELDGFSHINVLWWAHLFDDEKNRSYTMSVKPYKKAPEKMTKLIKEFEFTSFQRYISKNKIN